jgi:putative hydrolase of the HAD superfamily
MGAIQRQRARRAPHARSSIAWLFDLDNTLHDADPHIFPHLNRSMTAYLEDHLGLSREDANRLRMSYWRRYGATLLGLMRHHGVDPQHFLLETHAFPELPRMVLRHPLLRPVLTRLPGRKLVFSNSPVHYSRAVLSVLRVADVFDAIFCIEQTRYRPKPDRRGFVRLLHQHRLVARRCIMVEDSLANLRTAKRLGMQTVWISGASRSPPYVDVAIRHVALLPSILGRLRFP